MSLNVTASAAVVGCRELIHYAALVEEKRAGRPRAGLTRTQVEYCEEIERRMLADHDLFSEIPSVYLFTYVDKDGYVPPEVRGRCDTDAWKQGILSEALTCTHAQTDTSRCSNHGWAIGNLVPKTVDRTWITC